MFKNLLSVILLLIGSMTLAFGQLNVSLVGNLSYNEDLSDIWGYTAPNGTEYALVGTRSGTSVVSLANPANPVEVGFVAGANSIWRDIKTWGAYAYVTTDQGTDGLVVIDLTNLPNSISHTNWQPNLTLSSGASGTLERAHNIWIDENGYAYLSGANIGAKGILILDVDSIPGTPIYKGDVDTRYSHDCYTRGDTLWTADIFAGIFSVYDVTDKTNPVFMASHPTAANFTHNVWISDDGQTLFTTDEKQDAPVGAYDVSDLNNISALDQFRPLQTLGTGVIPHNVHVWDDYLLISYYSDGLIVVDASRPSNLVEVGNFDTYLNNGGGFNGSWGAYPFLPSGLVLVSDINSGLYVFQPNYVRACWLEGVVTDATNSNPINDVNIEILSTITTTDTDVFGKYATGVATAGSYDVKYSAPGYASQIVTVNLSNGQLVINNVQLMPLTPFSFTGQVVDINGLPIEGVEVIVSNADYTFEFISAANGDFSESTFYNGSYTVQAGKWGYKMIEITDTTLNQSGSSFVIELEAGYEDGFALDFGWLETSTAQSGDWVRAIPIGTFDGQTPIAPNEDVQGDIGSHCFVTGNAGGSIGNDDVDNGTVRLISPIFDASNLNLPLIDVAVWFVNTGGNGNPNDALIIELYNGDSTVSVEIIGTSTNGWEYRTINISEHIVPTSTMRIFFETSDLQGSGHIVEAGVDDFKLYEGQPVNTSIVDSEVSFFKAFPNPFTHQITLDFDLKTEQAQVRVFNITGQLMYQTFLNQKQGQIQFGEQFTSGVYFVQIIENSQISATKKVIKTN